MKTTLTLLSIISIIFFGCTDRDKSIDTKTKDKLKSTIDTFKQKQIEQDVFSNKQVDSLVLKIRANFSETNKITKWTKIQKEFLEGTNEGGEARFFFFNNKLKKITTDQMGETFRLVRDYYLDNSELIFVFESLEQYDRPFNRSNSKFFESRKYLYNGKIFKRISSDASKNPLDKISVMDDQKEILKEFVNLKILQQTNL